MRASFAAAALFGLATSLPAQAPGKWPPDSLYNLQVLPKDMNVIRLVGTMRNFIFDLGVRCEFCHVGKAGQPIAEFDFRSDEKRTKQVARQMLRMVAEINRRLDTLPGPTAGLQVSCATCHRGVSRPMPLSGVIAAAAMAGGGDSAIRAYKALRERYYGLDAYNFGEGSLNTAAFRLGQAGKTADALQVLDYNETLFPKSSGMYVFRGNIQLMAGDTAAAETAFREAVRLNPGNEEAAGRIRAVQGVDNTSPSVSRDGKLIAFVSRRGDPTSQLYVIAPDGTGERRVTAGNAPVGRARWSRDGRRLEFGHFARDTGALVSVALDGTGRREEVRVPGRGPVLLPDGRRVLYATGDWTSMQLTVAGRDGKNPRRISDGTGAIWGAALSPDGKRIAYGRSFEKVLQVWVMNLDGSGARQVTHWDPAEGSPQMPAWSPDGRRLAVQVDRSLPGPPARMTSTIWVVEVASGTATQVTKHDGGYLDELPAWFPDGKRIAFQSDRTGHWDIWVVNADGTGERRVTGGSSRGE